jgi:hypothetical protein
MATPEEKDGMDEINTRLDTLITSINDEIETMKINLNGEVNKQIKINKENNITTLTEMLKKITVIKNDLNSGEITNSSVLSNPNYEEINQLFAGGRQRTNRKKKTKRRKTNKRRNTKRRRSRK